MSVFRRFVDRLLGRGTTDRVGAPWDQRTQRSEAQRHPQSKSSLGSERIRRPPVVVGVDFGTSGTKIAFRDFGDPRRTPTVVDFGTRAEGYCRFSLPSVVRVSRGRVTVGEDALTGTPGDTVIRSPKISVLHDAVRAAPETGTPTDEELACALVIAQAVRVVRQCITDAADGAHRDLLFNLDVPVRDLDSHRAEPVFRRILTAGIHFSTLLPSRPVWDRAASAWGEAVREGGELGDLIPEAQAVMQGVSLLGRLPPDTLHAVLDVGAGTIDMGIFKLVSVMDGDRMPFWGADTHATGCDQLDERLCEASGVDAQLLDQIRAAKTRLAAGEGEVEVGGKAVTHEALVTASRWLASECWPTYQAVFGQAYRKQKNSNEWATLSTVVVGGGSLISPLRHRLTRPPRRVVKSVRAVELDGRLQCKVVGASDRPPTAAELPFLIPAVGPAHVKPELAQFVPPSAVEDDPGRDHRPTGLYDYEIGET